MKKNFLQQIINKLTKDGVVVTRMDQQNLGYTVKMNHDDAAMLFLRKEIEEEFSKELEKIDEVEKEKKKLELERIEFQGEKELLEKELERKEKIIKLEYEDTKTQLELAINAETNKEMIVAKKAVLENAMLKEKVKELQEQLVTEKQRTDKYTDSMADTLKTAFSNQNPVTINNK